MTGARQFLRAARDVRAERAGRPAPADIAYAIYVGVFAGLIVLSPVVRLAILGLLEAEPQLSSPAVEAVLRVVLGALLTALVAVGGTRGPVTPTSFYAQFVGASALPRRLTLMRPYLLSASGVMVVVLSAAGLSVIAVSLLGLASWDSALLFLAAVLLYCLLLSAGWLLGQVLSSLTTLIVVVVLALATAATVVVEPVALVTPWGWVGRLWPGTVVDGAFFWWPVLALAATAALALALVPILLDRLHGPTLVQQARRWESVGMMTTTGDVAGALGTFRPPPRWGRRLHLRLPRSRFAAYLVRDAVGALRTPARAALACAVLLSSGWLMGCVYLVADGVRWAPALAAAVLAFLAVGVFSDGARHAAAIAGQPPLFRATPLQLAALHTPFPAIIATVFLGAGAALTSFVGAPAEAIAWAVLLGIFLVLVRLFDAAKGPLPVELLMPVPTPVGDVSILSVIVWQSDALLISLIAAGGLTWLMPGSFGTAALWLAASTAAVIALAIRRYRAADAPLRADRPRRLNADDAAGSLDDEDARAL
ncbi:MAG TPA: hypothetical protein VGP24_01040 [Glaciihabitans sp.]|nr:hypothetical protein [Glaciihabitans sp.]